MAASDSGVQVIFSKFPKVSPEVNQACEDITEETANAIVAKIKATTPNKDIPVTLKRDGDSRTVVVGSARTFWAGFMEYGTVDQAARPFVTPAAEAEREGFMSRMRGLERRLDLGR